MRLQRMACAAFGVKPEVMTEVDRQLSMRVSQNLSTQFHPTPAEKTWYFPYWAFFLNAGHDKFVVSIGKSNSRRDFWILRIYPGAPRVMVALLRSQTAEHVFAELFTVCRAIHVCLAATPGFVDLHWWFSRRRPSFWTPEQLFEMKYKKDGWAGLNAATSATCNHIGNCRQ